MTQETKNGGYKKFILACAGMFILVLGVRLILVWWADVLVFFRGVIGMSLAFIGLLILYFLKQY